MAEAERLAAEAATAHAAAEVLTTPGVQDLIDATASVVAAYLSGLSGPSAGPLTVAIGCASGRHRAAVVGMHLAAALINLWHVATGIIHCGLNKDVVAR
ncbi:hypothetical protein [Actinomadura sp. DC4]|uniref:RapZ C-terminal domain-containing protein n=1 Tax=Actinomadura sp. DC4 TaxID=3055069 RepID=UPI0025B1D178|nr:hypothetical protein [Actinomadura sp. DC4]MDN3352306.1 hypothetical protein [Actinomadura sp. DC4]